MGNETNTEASLSIYYLTNPDVVLREDDQDSALLFNPGTNQIRALNITGLFIWKLCNGNRDLSDLISVVAQEFDEAQRDQVTSQVQAFIEELIESGFMGIYQGRVKIN